MCYRAGDNAQIRALAERLGWNVEVKRLAYRPGGRLIDVFRGTNLWGIDRKRSSPLEGPWPDLIISASMRNEPVCRWIQAPVGRPRALRPHRQALGRRVPLRPRDLRTRVPVPAAPTC